MRPNDHLVMIGFGGGLTWAASVVQWNVTPKAEVSTWHRFGRQTFYGLSRVRCDGAAEFDYLPFDRVLEYVRSARAIVTHAGVGSVTGILGDLSHLFEKLLFAGENLLGRRIARSAGAGQRRGFELGVFFRLQVSFGQAGAVVVTLHRLCQHIKEGWIQGRSRPVFFTCLPLSLCRAFVNAQRTGERLDR